MQAVSILLDKSSYDLVSSSNLHRNNSQNLPKPSDASCSDKVFMEFDHSYHFVEESNYAAVTALALLWREKQMK